MKSKFVLANILAAACLLFISPRLHAQCNPAISSGAYVLGSNSFNHGLGNEVWICSGVYDSTNSNLDTYYIEPGGILYGMNGIQNTVYVPRGATLIYNQSAIGNTVYFVDSADITFGSSGNGTLNQCTDIIFDYTNAPKPGCVQMTAVSNVEPETFELYPNPAGKSLVVRLASPGIAELNIYNLVGEKIFSEGEINSLRPGQLSEITIDVSSLKKGLYLFQLNNNGNFYYRKFVKE